MLTAPPVDGVRDEEGGGRERTELSLQATEFEEPPPFHVESRGEEPWLCSRRLSPKPSWPRLVEVRVRGSDRRPGERGGADFKEIGGRSEP